MIDDGKGGVNPGDRRAIWYVIKRLPPKSVLEAGTHIGASTVHIAAALRSNAVDHPQMQPRLVTVDVVDVWRAHGPRASPRQMVKAIGCDGIVTFVTEKSLSYPRAGVVLLHDYFPENRPLWANRQVIRGPYLATTRLKKEGLPINVLPLGDLPWKTKLGTNRDEPSARHARRLTAD